MPISNSLIYVQNPGSGTATAASRTSPVFNLGNTTLVPPLSSQNGLTGTWDSSAYSSSDAWLDRVQPRIAIISCGRHNAFGHPSPDTLERLGRHGVKTYRTDTDGAVTLELRPQGWTATTMLHPTPR